MTLSQLLLAFGRRTPASAPELTPLRAAAASGALGFCLAEWRARRSERRARRATLELLSALDDHMLADIGLMRADLHGAVLTRRR